MKGGGRRRVMMGGKRDEETRRRTRLFEQHQSVAVNHLVCEYLRRRLGQSEDEQQLADESCVDLLVLLALLDRRERRRSLLLR